jgi:2-polyprenyl-3-methyl-5-hydroxy-6-metoxy-1,4-benzoquinol methylase
MRKEWVKYICDPIDKTDLEIHSISKMVKGGIDSGILKSKSGNFYKIKNGVPILLTKNTQSVESVNSFGYEWNEFDFDYGKEGWLRDIVAPALGGTDYFKDKIIVDCGAGSGRQSFWMAQSGAKFIFCLELSSAARTIIKKVTKPYKDKIFVIQADISHLPINTKNVNINLVYCINVIQHTQNVENTVIELSKLLARKSTLLFNIYMIRGRKSLLKILDLLRYLTKRIPYRLLKYCCFLLTCLFYPLSYLPVVREVVGKVVPISHSFKETWLCFYDLLGSHEYQKFYSQKEVRDILKKAKLRVMKRAKYAFLLKKK